MSTECPLTQRQADILSLIADGKTQTEISSLEGVSGVSVTNILVRAKDKAGAATTAGLVAMAIRKGWIQ